MLAGFFCGCRAWVTDTILCNLCGSYCKIAKGQNLHVRFSAIHPLKILPFSAV